jgi:uncharacterized protein with PIN domain
MLSFRCPKCSDTYLLLAHFELVAAQVELGKPARVALECPSCHTKYLLRYTVTEIV